MSKQINKKTLISIDGITKKFGKGDKEFTAVDKLTFNIAEGENIALIGANGAGKTTTIEMILGINKPNEGKISYKYTDSWRQIKKFLGVQFQDSIYPSYISVKAIVNFIIDAYNIKISEKELASLVRAFKVESFYTQNANSLSGGQSQRLNILLALLHKPKIVFLDELSTGLDITTRNEFKKFIKNYAKVNKITIVLISHDVGEIMALTERMIILKKGKIYKDQKISNFKNADELEKFIEDNIN